MRYVTPQQVVDFIQGVSSVGNSLIPASIMLIIDGIEAAVDRALGGASLISQTFTEEIYRIDQREFSKLYGDILTVPKYMLKLNHGPVSELTSIKQVTSWNETTGAIETTSTIPNSRFQLLEGRFVVFNSPFGVPIDQPYYQPGSLVPLLSQFDSLGITLLITYTGGLLNESSDSGASSLADLRLGILIEIMRYHQMVLNKAFHVSSIDNEFGHQNLTRFTLTPETQGMLRRLKGLVIG